MPSSFSRSLAGFTIAVAGTHSIAQTVAQPVALPEVTITGNPLGSSELAAPASQLSGTGLLLRGQSTLGETLNALPGVSSTYFGPAASRPVVRGLDGDRIRILSNSGAALDASNLSYDHAVAMDPIAIERVEVLRGPATLLYGGNALGGVVNLIDNRIPKESLATPIGKVDAGYASGNRETAGAVLVEGGTKRFGLHADAFDRRSDAMRVPGDLACTQDGVTTTSPRLCNSDGRSRGGALGGSVFFDEGYLGASTSTYRNAYGSVAEDEVRIGMQSNRYALEGEWRSPLAGWHSLKLQASHSDYRHTEYDAGVAGTVFANRGNDVRVEARHDKVAGLEGVIGFQSEQSRFSADGAEAFAPHTRNRAQALFAYEEWARPWGKLTGGLRLERVTVDSLGNAAEPRFFTDSRTFTPLSLAFGALWKAAPDWQLTVNLASSRRAPKDYELFANGPHIATGAWEVGDPTLAIERARQLDLGVQWKRGANSLRANVFQSSFDNYIALLRTGALVGDDPAELLPEFAYRPVRAKFRGLETGGTLRLMESPTTLDLELRADLVRADNLSAGEPMPRIAPTRIGATLVAAHGAWTARLGFDHHATQDRVPAGDVPVAGYTLWQAALTWSHDTPSARWLWYARVDNATDRLSYSATSILTQSLPGRVPLPGRSFKLGVRANF